MRPAARQQQEHIGAARQRLGHLAELAAKTEAAERRILASAQDMLTKVEEDLPKLRSRANAEPDAAERYQALVLERGHLTTIIAQARQTLGEAG